MTPVSHDEHREERREQLLDVAVALVRSEGPFVTMEQLAAANGVTKPIIYRHFGDRDGLVLAIARRFVDELVEALGPHVAADAPAETRLRGAIDAYLALVERDPNLYRFLSQHAAADRRDLLASLVAQAVALTLEDLLAAAGQPTDPAELWAYGLVGMVHFAGDWWVDQQPRAPRQEVVEHLLALVAGGITQATSSLDLSPEEPR
ncbi:MAG: TetR/AcrR family transcriptional regulator [Acidimicrobiia bacterium]|nr:TetR/AcrR family transcriptional regulator [Acidimicrobiia bacterium]